MKFFRKAFRTIGSVVKLITAKMSASTRGGRGGYSNVNRNGGDGSRGSSQGGSRGGGGDGNRGSVQGCSRDMSRGRGNGRGSFRGGTRGIQEQMEKVSLGTPKDDGSRSVHVLTNHFKLRWTGGAHKEKDDFIIHQFQVEFIPADIAQHLRRKFLEKAKEAFEAQFVYDGEAQLYCPNKFTDNEMIIKAKSRDDDAEHAIECTIRANYVKSLPYSDPIYPQVYNLIVRKCLRSIGLDEIGQHFYDSENVIKFPNFKLDLWPGYMTSIKSCEKGTLLCVDVTHKVIRSMDLLSLIYDLKYAYDHESPEPELPMEKYILNGIKGCMVITPYNKKTYTVADLKMESICGLKFVWKEGEISLMDYYRTRYAIEVKDKMQPVVISNVKGKKGEGGKREIEQVMLLPELCNLIGLTDEMRANNTIMRKLSEHLHLVPTERVKMLNKFITKLETSTECQQVLKSWGFALEPRLKDCTIGRVLPSETMIFADSNTFRADEKNDFTKALRSCKMLVCVPLKNWVVVCGEKDAEKAREFVMTMQKVAKPLGFQISSPASLVKLDNTRLTQYIRSMELVVAERKEGLQLIFCVLPGSTDTSNAELYGAIKRRLTRDFGIPSQCVLSKNLYSKNAMSIATKMVVQMNTKLGGEPWTIEFPPEFQERTMAVGFDYCGKGNKTGAIVGSLNSDCSRYYSIMSLYQGAEVKDKLKEGIQKLLDVYTEENKGTPPDRVLFYINNVDEGSVTCGRASEDAAALNKAIQEWYESRKVGKVNFVYFALGRRNVTRLMAHFGSCATRIDPQKVVNPPPGTVVDTEIVEKDGKFKEFFMIPTVARQGTVRAMHYWVLLDTNNIPAHLLQAYTYKLCHLYYNWSGAVNVPSVCQYAAKMAKQTSQAMSNLAPKENMGDLLHYL